MPVQFESGEQFDLITLHGELTASEIMNVRTALDKTFLETNSTQVVVDLADVTLVDSGGIGFLVYLYKQAIAARKKLGLASAQGQPLDMIHLLKINEVIECKDSVADFQSTA